MNELFSSEIRTKTKCPIDIQIIFKIFKTSLEYTICRKAEKIRTLVNLIYYYVSIINTISNLGYTR